MKDWLFVLAVLVLWSQACHGRATDSEAVSDYTGATGGGGTLDVYRQIAGNIAERITQPIYRFFGLENTTKAEKTTKRPFEHIELYSSEVTNRPKTGKSVTIDTTLTAPDKIDTQPNEIQDRDVEELSEDSARKSDKKPEKITLFSSYLPVKENLDLNVTTTESSDKSLELDDVEPDEIEVENDADETGRGPFVYVLELIGSIIQLLWGGFLTLFKPSSYSSR